MNRRALAAAVLLAALAATVLLVQVLDPAATQRDESLGGAQAPDAGTPAGPGLHAHGTPPRAPGDGLDPPGGPLPANVLDEAGGIDPGQARIGGTVRLRGTPIPACSGRVELLLVKPEHWPGSWEALERLLDDRAFFEGIDHHAEVAEDGAWHTDVTRGVRIVQARIRAVPGAAPRIANFLDTVVPVRREVVEERAVLDLEVSPGLTIEGRVRDEGTGRGVAGARVIRAGSAAPAAGGVCGPDGTFLVAGLRSGDLEAEGYPPLEFLVGHPDYVGARAITRFDAGLGAYAPLDVRLRGGVRVGGIVRMDGKEPRNAVPLFLLAGSGAGVPLGAGERELARTVSGAGGRFAFPPVEPVAEATLYVPSQGQSLYGGGAGFERRGLDLGADRLDLVVELTDAWGAALRARFPDGALAGREQSRALVQDVLGAWCPVTWGGRDEDPPWWVSVAPGHAHPVVVFAQREEEGVRRCYRGEQVVRFRTPEEARRGIWVDLVPWEPTPVPPPEPRVLRAGFGAPMAGATRVWLLRFEDQRTGEPPGPRTLRIETTGSTFEVRLREDGRLRLELGLGQLRLAIRVEGFEALELRVEPREPGYEEVVVRLRPLPDG